MGDIGSWLQARFRAGPGWESFASHYITYLIVALATSALWFEVWFRASLRASRYLIERANDRSPIDVRLRLTKRLLLLEQAGISVAMLAPFWFSTRRADRHSPSKGKRHLVIDAATALPSAVVSSGRLLRWLLRPIPLAILALGVVVVRPDTWNQIRSSAEALFGWLAADRAANLLVLVALLVLATRLLLPKFSLLGRYDQARRDEAIELLKELAQEYRALGTATKSMVVEAEQDWDSYERNFIAQYSSPGLRRARGTSPPSTTESPPEDISIEPQDQQSRLWAKPEFIDPIERVQRPKEHQTNAQRLISEIRSKGLVLTVVQQRGWLCPNPFIPMRIKAPPYPVPPRPASTLDEDEIRAAVVRSRQAMARWFADATEIVARCELISDQAVPEPLLRDVTRRLKE